VFGPQHVVSTGDVMSTIHGANIHELITGMINEGLSYVALYLEKVCRQVIICDNFGKIHYPHLHIQQNLPDLYIKIPAGIPNDDYIYTSDKRIYYHLGSYPTNAYIILNNVRREQVQSILSLLHSDVGLAIRFYFANKEYFRKDKDKLKRDLSELMLPYHNDITKLLMLHTEELSPFKPYFFSIMEADSPEDRDRVDWNEVRSFSQEYLERNHVMAVQIPSSNCVMGLVPASADGDECEINEKWFVQNAIKHKKALENHFNIRTSVGEGNVYPLSNIYKSYLEATVSIYLPKLMGYTHFIKRFSDLGVFSLIFNNDINTLKSFYLNFLGPLLDYDNINEGILLPTLRNLLENCFNWKATAEQMYVHVNTLYYRVNKAEQLMNVNLSQMQDRVNTYLAIKVYDMLNLSEFLN